MSTETRPTHTQRELTNARIIDLASSNANAAWDQRCDYPTPEDAKDAYLTNLLDSLVEEGLNDVRHGEFACREFEKHYNHIVSPGTYAVTAQRIVTVPGSQLWQSSNQVPAFTVQASSHTEALKIAREILGGGELEISVSQL